ncbi:MAG: formylglycine-generating enzyme family protein, partial [Pseudoxanthomonas sp.]
MRLIRYLLLLSSLLVAACKPAPEAVAPAGTDRTEAVDPRLPSITVSGDESGASAWNWQPPTPLLTLEGIPAARREAAEALAQQRLFERPGDAIPLYLAIQSWLPGDEQAAAGLDKALRQLLAQGGRALGDADDQADALSRAGEIAAVARTVAPQDERVVAYLKRVDLADQLWKLNAEGERDLRNGQIGNEGAGVVEGFREALALSPGQARALQGLAATESAMIRLAEEQALAGDFDVAARWLGRAASVRDNAGTIDDARQRIRAIRNARITALRESGTRDLTTMRGLRTARLLLAEVLRIAEPGDPVAADFRERIDLATYYGSFKPGQAFT